MMDIENILIESVVKEDHDVPIYTTPAVSTHQSLKFFSVPLSSHLLKISIEVDAEITKLLFLKSIEFFKGGNIDGIDQNNVPLEYINEIYRGEITKKVKHYLFQHLITDVLMYELSMRKINIANYFRLSTIEMHKNQKFIYHFDVSIADQIELKEWKNFSFKPPKRKKYKDLDKQVVSFIETQSLPPKKNRNEYVEENDWILFEALLLDQKEKMVSSLFLSSFWICVGHQEVREPFVQELLGKTLQSDFVTTSLDMLYHDATFYNPTYSFRIKIKAIVKGGYFSIDTFRSSFKLKNRIDVHNKLMEVFSYRNDISQRKAIVEEVFHLLLAKHRFEVPKHLVLRRQEDIVFALTEQPDYHVYKANKDFESYVEMLAEKQLKEEIIIDQITHTEHMKTDLKDIAQYLHLWSNKRLKEFIYFKPILIRLDDPETLINTTIFNQAVLREKTLNHVIHLLIKQ